MLQMVGVLLLALGLHPMFVSVANHGDTLDNDVMVWGYVVMRVAMILQWWRAGRQDDSRRRTFRAFIVTIAVAQVLWCGLAFADLPVGTTFVLMLVPFLVEVEQRARCGVVVGGVVGAAVQGDDQAPRC